jgi:predicted Zn-dependent peptidase
MHVEQTILANGLLVITGALPHLESAACGVFVNAGARHETEQNNGAAHFCEHLMFKGTTSRTAYDIAKQIEVLGSEINAFTSKDMTAYYTTGLATHIDASVEIIGDALVNSLFAPAEIKLESGVIIQEINRSDDDPGSVMQDALCATAYPDQSIGRTILGSSRFVTEAGSDDIRAFTGQYYTADNMVVVGTGGIAHDAFVHKVEKAFADLPRSAFRPQPDPVHYVGGLVIDRSREFKQVSAGIAFESVPVLDDKMYHHSLLAEAFGGAMSSPLFTEIREKRGLVYSTGCYAAMNTDHGRIIIYGGMTAGNVEEFMLVACQEFRKLCDTISETDLLRAKNSHLTSLAMLRERPFSTACFMARSHWQRGRVREMAEMRDGINQVTLDDLKSVARFALSSAPTIALIGPVPQADYAALVDTAAG